MQIVSVLDRSARQWVRLWLSGDVNAACQVSILRSAIGAVLRSSTKGVTIDLGGVGSLAPSGVDELRRAVLSAADGGTWIELVNAPLPVHRLIQADPVLGPVLETYAWKRPEQRQRVGAGR